jgi:hypothetical protein
MAIMHVPLVELLCQTVMGHIQALEYMPSGMCGLLRPCPIVPGTKCHHFRRQHAYLLPKAPKHVDWMPGLVLG